MSVREIFKGQWPRAFLVLALAVIVLPAGLAADDDEKEDFVVVKGARIITVCGEEIETGTIVIKNGVIEAVGKNVEIPFPARIVDADGLVVLPGLINPCTLIGNRAYSRGGVQAHMKVADDFDPDKETLDDVLKAGFTTLGFRPRGSGIPGTAMAARPVPDCGSDSVLNRAAFVFMEADSPSRDKRLLKSAFDTAKKEIEKQEKAKKEWDEKQKKAAEEAKKKAEAEKKQAEQKGEKKEQPKPQPEKKDKKEEKKEPAKFTPPPIKPPYAPIVDLIRKKEGVRAFVAFGQASDYVHFEDGLEDYEFDHLYVLRNNRSDCDLPLVIEKLGKKKARVVVMPTINFRPLTRNRFNLPRLLVEAGCVVALRPSNDSAKAHGEYLRQVAALVAAGLDRSVALEAMTLRPAEMLGISDRVGTIEKGREADLLFLTGDPFDLATRVDKVMVKGEVVEGRHEIQ